MGIYSRRIIRLPLLILMLLSIAAAAALVYYNVWIGIIFIVGAAGGFIYAFRYEKATFEETEYHIESLSYRMKQVGEESFLQLPYGILLVNENFIIEWANPFMHEMTAMDSLIGEEVNTLSESFYRFMKPEELTEQVIEIKGRKFNVLFKPENHTFYFMDVTEQLQIEEKYEADRTVIGILFIDNYDEITQTMDDQGRSTTNQIVTSIVNDWAAEYGVFIKRVASDRFIAVMNESILQQLEEKKFAILDTIREKTLQKNLSFTLSIGIGVGSNSLIELGTLAQSGLDLVLGRGGDQVAIKQPNGKLRFYGGKTNPVEKRTRVRARVISHALRDLIQESDRVFIMGHRNPDMDSIGAAIGVSKMAEMNKIESYIVLNFNELNGSVQRLMAEIETNEDLYNRFIPPDEVLSKITQKSLLVIVDTHKPSMVIDSRILSKTEKLVVIDHHRRSEEFLTSPTLVYMEPYASSTAELVTELLEYQPQNSRLTMLESTALLSGIIVDTKSFTLRTGARTFEAASYLRTNGADTTLIQRLLKEDIDTYIERAKLIQTVEFVLPGIAVARSEENRVYDSVLIAQTADILLTMKDVSSSFVIANREGGQIGISARSLGDVNVQLVMEKLGGGGHLTNAATQIDHSTIDEVKERLKQAILEVVEGSKES